MTEVLQANIFFLITGIAVIIFASLCCVALFHGIKLLKSLRRIVARIEEGAETLTEEVHQFRSHMRGGGVVRKLARFLFARERSAEVMEDEDETATDKSDRKRGGLKD